MDEVVFRAGVLPLNKVDLKDLNSSLVEAWDRLERILDNYAETADRIKQYMSGYAGATGALWRADYARLARASIPYLVNMLIISGPPGSGKSTLLSSIAAAARSELYSALFRSHRVHSGSVSATRLHVILDIIDVTLIPSTDTILNWLLRSLYSLVEEITEHVKMYNLHGFDKWNLLLERLESLISQASRINLDAASLIRIAGDLEEYGQFAAETLHSGYAIPVEYMHVVDEFRSLLSILAGRQVGVIGYILDDLDALEAPRLLEAILSCKLLSLDPYTICIVSIKDKSMLASRINEYLEMVKAAGSLPKIMHTIDLAYVVEKLVFNAPSIILPKVTAEHVKNHRPLNFAVLAKVDHSKIPALSELAEKVLFARLRGTKAEQKLTLASLLFDSFNGDGGNLEPKYENLYARNLQMLRCLDRLYLALYEATEGGKKQIYLDAKSPLLRNILEILSTCTIESEYAAALGFDMHLLLEGLHVQQVCSESQYIELYLVHTPGGAYESVLFNLDALTPRLVTPGSQRYLERLMREKRLTGCGGKPAYGGRAGWFDERYLALASLMRDIAWLAGSSTTTNYEKNFHFIVFAGVKLPVIRLESIEYVYRLAVLLSLLAERIRERISRNELRYVIDPQQPDDALQALYTLLSYIVANITVAAYAYDYSLSADAGSKLLQAYLKLLDVNLEAFKEFINVLEGELSAEGLVTWTEVDAKAGKPQELYAYLKSRLSARIGRLYSMLTSSVVQKCKGTSGASCSEVAEIVKQVLSSITFEKLVKENVADTHAVSKAAMLNFIDAMLDTIFHEKLSLDRKARTTLAVILFTLRGG